MNRSNYISLKYNSISHNLLQKSSDIASFNSGGQIVLRVILLYVHYRRRATILQ